MSRYPNYSKKKSRKLIKIGSCHQNLFNIKRNIEKNLKDSIESEIRFESQQSWSTKC